MRLVLFFFLFFFDLTPRAAFTANLNTTSWQQQQAAGVLQKGNRRESTMPGQIGILLSSHCAEEIRVFSAVPASLINTLLYSQTETYYATREAPSGKARQGEDQPEE